MLLAGYGDIANTEGKHLVKDFESGKEKKGFMRDSNGDLIKSKAYLNHDGLKRTNTTSAYEAFTAKGIKKSVADGELRHTDFKRCLLDNIEAPRVFIPTLRSVKHQVYMFDSEKKTLDALDDKRHTLTNGCDSLAHGHYMIKNGYERKYRMLPRPVTRDRKTYEEYQTELEAIEDAPLIRMRETQKRMREKNGGESSVMRGYTLNIPGLKFGTKIKTGPLSIEEMRALR